MLLAELREDEVLTETRALASLTDRDISQIFTNLKQTAASNLAGVTTTDQPIKFEGIVDMRYAGQEHTVPVPLDLDRIDLHRIASAFHSLHDTLYTFSMNDPVECVHFRLVATIPQDHGMGEIFTERKHSAEFSVKTRPLLLEDSWVSAVIVSRLDLPLEKTVEGPAIIEEEVTSTVVYPGQKVLRDDHDCLVLEQC